jgi:predicted secreted Zn-dependent protease
MELKYLLLLAAVAAVTPAGAEALSRIHTSFYYVDGGSATVIMAQMDKSGPKAEDGKRYPSKTRWDVQWKYNHLEEGVTCGVKDVAVAVGIAQNLPRWRGEGSASGALALRWKKFAEAVQRHEDGHKENGIKAATEIEAALQALKPASNCEDLDKAANAAGEQIIDKYRKRDAAYDRSTNNGRKQGMTLL